MQITKPNKTTACVIAFCFMSCLAAGAQVKEKGKGELTKGVSALKQLNTALQRARKELQPSLLRLEIDRPGLPRTWATGIMIEAGVVVSSHEAVAGAKIVLGDPLVDSEYSVLLKLAGSSNGIAVLTGKTRGIKGLKPVAKGESVNLKHGSLVILLDGGSPYWQGIALPAALVRFRRLKLGGGTVKGPGLSPFGLKGLIPSWEDRGGLICDLSFKMVGILSSRYSPFIKVAQRRPSVGKHSRGRSRSSLEKVRIERPFRAFNVALVLPVEQVARTVEFTLRRVAKKGLRPSPRPIRLGVTVVKSGERLKIDRVIYGMPAQKAGLKKGDIITHLNGSSVKTLDSFKRHFSAVIEKPGDITLRVLRGGKEFSVPIELNG